MPYPLQSGGVGGTAFLFVLVVYLSFALLYLLFPVLMVSFLRGERGRLERLVPDRIDGFVRDRVDGFVRDHVDRLVPGRLGERLGAGRSGAVGSRDR